jgi:hypothetical protein
VTVYRYNVVLTAFLMCVTGAMSALLLTMLNYFVRALDLVGIIVTAVTFVFVILVLRALLSRATIVVDDRQIAAYTLGMRTKAMRWQDIKKIRKVRVTNGYNYVDSFDVVDRRPHNPVCRFFLVNLCGDIVFTQDISDMRGLLQQINFCARQHDVPLVVSDSEAAVAKLRTKTGKEFWKEAFAKEEVRVTEF